MASHSSMRYTKITIKLRFLAILLSSLCFSSYTESHNTPAPILKYAKTRIEQERLNLDLVFHIDHLPSFYLSSLSHGIPLYMCTEAILEELKWHLFSNTLAKRHIEWKVSYHQLTEKYRLTQGSIYRVFDSFRELLEVVSRTWSWEIYDKIQKNKHYIIRTRWYIDNSRLPLIFQVGHLATEDWTFNSGWTNIHITQNKAEYGVEEENMVQTYKPVDNTENNDEPSLSSSVEPPFIQQWPSLKIGNTNSQTLSLHIP